MKKLTYTEHFSIRKCLTDLIDNDLIFECLCNAHANIYYYAINNIEHLIPGYNYQNDDFQMYFDDLYQCIPVYKTKHFNHFAANQLLIDFMYNN